MFSSSGLCIHYCSDVLPFDFFAVSVERDCACVYVNISVYTLISVFSPPQLWNSSSHYCTHSFICTLVCICTPMTKVFPHFLTHCSAWPYCRERERVFEKLMQLLGNSFSSVMGDCSEIEALGSGASCGSSTWPLSSGMNCLHCQCLF